MNSLPRFENERFGVTSETIVRATAFPKTAGNIEPTILVSACEANALSVSNSMAIVDLVSLHEAIESNLRTRLWSNFDWLFLGNELDLEILSEIDVDE